MICPDRAKPRFSLVFTASSGDEHVFTSYMQLFVDVNTRVPWPVISILGDPGDHGRRDSFHRGHKPSIKARKVLRKHIYMVPNPQISKNLEDTLKTPRDLILAM